MSLSDKIKKNFLKEGELREEFDALILEDVREAVRELKDDLMNEMNKCPNKCFMDIENSKCKICVTLAYTLGAIDEIFGEKLI